MKYLGHNHGCGCYSCCQQEEAAEREEEAFEADAEMLASRASWKGDLTDEEALSSAKSEIEWVASFHKWDRITAATYLLRTYA